eukprot:1157898-Pelagomonas_calceolata.AAC.10
MLPALPGTHITTLDERILQERIKGAAPNAIILSGGPNSVHLEGSPRVPAGFFEWAEASKIPVLGICYGMQVRGAGTGAPTSEENTHVLRHGTAR